MKGTKWILFFSLIFLFGCTQAQTGNVVQTMEKVSKDPSVTVTNAPDESYTGQQFTIAWKIDGEGSTQHTAVHYGPSSVSNPTAPSDYPKATEFQCQDASCNLPNSFSASLSIGTPGKYYYRAHTIVDGKNYWSDEKEIMIEARSTNEATGQMTKTQPKKVVTQVDKPKISEIESDDNGFYMDGKKITSLSAVKGTPITLSMKVRTTNVYYGGLKFEGCNIESGKVSPGSSTEIKFTTQNDCTITSYWPLKDVKKADLKIDV